MFASCDQSINWRQLRVYDGDTTYDEDDDGCALEDWISADNADILRCELADDGSIDTWPQCFIAAPGEEPDCDTPRVPVDWTGFRQALATAIEAQTNDD